jgi:fatty-acyl-CoA synthase
VETEERNVHSPLGADPYDRIAELTIGRLLAAVTAEVPDDEALVIAGERLTYAQLLERAERFARALVGLGVRRGDHVCLLMPNSAHMVTAIFGTALAGAVLVPINARFRETELSFVLRDAEPVCIVASDITADYLDFIPLLHAALPGLAETGDPCALAIEAAPTLRAVAMLGGSSGAGILDEAAFYAAGDGVDLPADDAPVTDVAAIIYTSGTTSNPRGAILTHRALVGHWSLAGELWDFRRGDRFWDPCPLFHIAGVGPLMWCVAHGVTFVSDTFFEAGSALATIVAERATQLYPTYPPIMRDLMTHPNLPSSDLSRVRSFLNVAPPDDLRAMQAAIPNAAEISLYGSTEGGPVTMHNVLDPIEFRIETNGRPLKHVQVGIFTVDTDNEVPQGESGEIRYRGPNTLSGYWRDAEKSAATIDAGGWVHTGDVGSISSDGTLHFLGRVKEMLKVGGENVAPAEVEEVLGTHPAVKLTQVVGMPDARLTEVVAAFVELAPGQHADEAELIEYCRARMARYKVPRAIRFVTEWPMSATKIQRAKLAQLILDELAANQ